MGRHLEFRYADHRRLIGDLANSVAGLLRQAIAERGQAFLAVSGGRSPTPLFEALRTIDLPWSSVTVTLVDERCLPPEHPDSNALLVRRHLLQERAVNATFIPYFERIYDSDEQSLEGLCAEVNGRLASLPWPLDIAILGMGSDGHTASLFPASRGFAAAIDGQSEALCRLVYPAQAPYPRLTLSLRTLLAARHRLLQFSGRDKIAIYEQAQITADPAIPVSLLLHHPSADNNVWIGE